MILPITTAACGVLAFAAVCYGIVLALRLEYEERHK